MFKLTSYTVSRRLITLILAAVLGIIFLASVFLFSERHLIMQERENSVRQTVETVHSLAAHYHALAANGSLPEAEAKKQAIAAIKALRYSKEEYFWINDADALMLMHPIKPELDGKNLINLKDPTGKLFFSEMASKVKSNGSGFVHYMWPKPGHETPVPKISYVQGFSPWNWIIGSGVYVDTVDSVIAERVISFSLGSLALAGCLALLGWLIAR
ncbi:MAG: cache domain-containing protein, partial [Burkholderiaceae bacterium]|nr:cache domain-containing protein [Burkholderiaceae bacterium]